MKGPSSNTALGQPDRDLQRNKVSMGKTDDDDRVRTGSFMPIYTDLLSNQLQTFPSKYSRIQL